MGKYTTLAPVEKATIMVEGGAEDSLDLEIQRKEAEYIPKNHSWEWG